MLIYSFHFLCFVSAASLVPMCRDTSAKHESNAGMSPISGMFSCRRTVNLLASSERTYANDTANHPVWLSYGLRPVPRRCFSYLVSWLLHASIEKTSWVEHWASASRPWALNRKRPYGPICSSRVMGWTVRLIVARLRQVEKAVLTGPVNQSSVLANRNWSQSGL